MQESGISSVFQQIYAELSAPAIPSGKEMSREKKSPYFVGLYIDKTDHFNGVCSLSTEKQSISLGVQICLPMYKS